MRNTVVAVVVVFLIIGFIGGLSVARMKYRQLLLANSAAIISKDAEFLKLQKENKAQLTQLAANKNTSYVLQNGKMMVMIGSNLSPMTKDVTLPSGTKIMVNGTVIEKDGSKIKLSEGQSFFSN